MGQQQQPKQLSEREKMLRWAASKTRPRYLVAIFHDGTDIDLMEDGADRHTVAQKLREIARVLEET